MRVSETALMGLTGVQGGSKSGEPGKLFLGNYYSDTRLKSGPNRVLANLNPKIGPFPGFQNLGRQPH